jgi:hypothetical protein
MRAYLLIRRSTDGQMYRVMKPRIRRFPTQKYLAQKIVRCICRCGSPTRSPLLPIALFRPVHLCVPPGRWIRGAFCDSKKTFEIEANRRLIHRRRELRVTLNPTLLEDREVDCCLIVGDLWPEDGFCDVIGILVPDGVQLLVRSGERCYGM